MKMRKREDQFWSREEQKIQSDEVGQCEGKKLLRCDSDYASMKFKTYSGLAFTNICKKIKWLVIISIKK